MSSLFSPDEKNVFGYLAREFETLDERPLGDVDSLALACASYYRLPPEAASARGAEGMPVTDLLRADWVSGMTEGLWDPDGLSRLLVCMAASPRLHAAPSLGRRLRLLSWDRQHAGGLARGLQHGLRDRRALAACRDGLS